MTGPQLTQVAGLPIPDPELAAAVSDGLDRVEDLLRREVHSDYRFVTDTSLHLIEAGGKRFRPLLTLLAAQLAGGTSEDVVVAATSVELVHLATLYHDDVMDEATMRRGGWSRSSGRTRCGSSPRRSPSSSPARCARPAGRARARTPSRTTWRWWPRRRAR
jgi:heptaprenyl diphosphate synthase